MTRTVIAALLAAITTAIVLRTLWDDDGNASQIESAPFAQESTLSAVEKQIDQQQRQLDHLQQQIDALSAQVGVAVQPLDYGDTSPGKEPRWIPPNVPRVGKAGLMDAGLSESDANLVFNLVTDLRSVRAQQIAESAAGFQATRTDLRESIETYVGTQAYDSYLFAAGQRNRLKVAKVLDGSDEPRDSVQAGDVLYALDGQRVYGLMDIQRIQSAGAAQDLIDLQLIRDGEHFNFFVSRGRLGMQFSSVRINPADQ